METWIGYAGVGLVIAGAISLWCIWHRRHSQLRRCDICGRVIRKDGGVAWTDEVGRVLLLCKRQCLKLAAASDQLNGRQGGIAHKMTQRSIERWSQQTTLHQSKGLRELQKKALWKDD